MLFPWPSVLSEGSHIGFCSTVDLVSATILQKFWEEQLEVSAYRRQDSVICDSSGPKRSSMGLLNPDYVGFCFTLTLASPSFNYLVASCFKLVMSENLDQKRTFFRVGVCVQLPSTQAAV